MKKLNKNYIKLWHRLNMFYKHIAPSIIQANSGEGVDG